jgi:tRNA uridine 5-carboxymethylaminomethyl modification enzyme
MRFDCVVVGGGHAGCEAAAAAARLGLSVAMVTFRVDEIGRLSCNPAVGGLGKGHLVRELDALGGLMGRVSDAACVQFRRLNTRKGLAVQASRAQVDVHVYPRVMQRTLAAIPNLTILEGEAAALRLDAGHVAGLDLADGTTLHTPRVILTTGTFLAGVMHCGMSTSIGGRLGDQAAHKLSSSLRDVGLRLGRLKTGTVPRLRRDSIAWDRVPEQEDRVPDGRFSFTPTPREVAPIPVHVTYTNDAVHAIIRGGLDRSPLFTGKIEGVGPRYCPSIEDKVVRFPDRDRHLLFLEPEGHETDRVYVNGLSTSLPADVQEAMVHAVEGLEDAVILQHGYAVEYDFADPRDLDHGLQHRHVPGLWLAGQVNGTSGYEEAAAQGLIAGISAALGEPFGVGREEGYLGVLVDDLVTKGVGGEPYRMFTSRAEHRLLLREDNADRRLMPRGRALGLVDDATWTAFEAREENIAQGVAWLDHPILPTEAVVARFGELGLPPPRKPTTVREVLRRPEATWDTVRALDPTAPALSAEAAEQVDIDAKYEGYIARAVRHADHASRMEGVALPPDVAWAEIGGLSTEILHRLRAAKPETLGQMARLPGITPAAVNLVAAWVSRRSGAPRRGPLTAE